jgi:hypothetical protein
LRVFAAWLVPDSIGVQCGDELFVVVGRHGSLGSSGSFREHRRRRRPALRGSAPRTRSGSPRRPTESTRAWTPSRSFHASRGSSVSCACSRAHILDRGRGAAARAATRPRRGGRCSRRAAGSRPSTGRWKSSR